MLWVQWFLENITALITTFNAVLVALIAFFMIIPGEQPEKFLRQVADFIGKFSKK